MSAKRANLLAYSVSTLLLACCLAFTASAQSKFSGQSSSRGTSAAPRSFATPEKAAEALIRATEAYDVADLMSIFGPEGEELVSSADPIRDRSNAVAFAAKARQRNTVLLDAARKKATLVVGDDNWPLPVPIVNRYGKWIFDAKAGRKEILRRRIGANELDAIQVCHGYVEAQYQYASEVHDNSGINQYAQRIVSTDGKQDGLYWRDENGNPAGPIGEAIARAIQEGYSVGGKSAYHGYYFKILKGQGPAARLGRIDYVIEGVMIGGFALLAVPAEYGVTGIKSFMVSNDGIVYQTDLGPDSLTIGKNMELYNPDKTWTRTSDSWPEPQTQDESYRVAEEKKP